MKKLLKKIRAKEQNSFDSFIFIIIVLSAIVIGVETDIDLYNKYPSFFHYFDIIILSIFVFEILIKLVAQGNKPWRYFFDGWNIFDFIIVLLCLLPYIIPNSSEDTHAFLAFRMLRLLRAIRVFRVFRLITHFEPLQHLVDSLLRSIPQMLYVVILLAIVFYVYGVTGHFLFSPFSPSHFGQLSSSIVTLFESIAGNWGEIMRSILSSTEKIIVNGEYVYKHIEYPSIVPIYFISFYLIAGLIIMNLFIGIIVSEMSNVKRMMRKKILENEIDEDLENEKKLTMIQIQRRADQLKQLTEKLKLIEVREQKLR